MSSDNNNSITVVTEFDVLCGRGGMSNLHPGNQLFRAIIKQNKELYHQLTDNAVRKQHLVSSIIKAIAQHGGRFLRTSAKEDEQWLEISSKQAYVKTCQALRDQDNNKGSDSSVDESIHSRHSTPPQHTQFQQARREIRRGRPRTIERQPSIRQVTLDAADKENSTPPNHHDDVPELIETEEIMFPSKQQQQQQQQQQQYPHYHYQQEEQQIFKAVEDDLSPLNPNEFIFENPEEFSCMCSSLLEVWSQ
jgi:hypothetical protein